MRLGLPLMEKRHCVLEALGSAPVQKPETVDPALVSEVTGPCKEIVFTEWNR